MIEHTPTPWAVSDDTVIHYDGDDEDVLGDFQACEVESIVEACCGHVDYKETDKANAALIVKCVNEHDDLMALANALLEFAAGDNSNVPAIDVIRTVTKYGFAIGATPSNKFRIMALPDGKS